MDCLMCWLVTKHQLLWDKSLKISSLKMAYTWHMCPLPSGKKWNYTTENAVIKPDKERNRENRRWPEVETWLDFYLTIGITPHMTTCILPCKLLMDCRIRTRYLHWWVVWLKSKKQKVMTRFQKLNWHHFIMFLIRTVPQLVNWTFQELQEPRHIL